MERLYINQIKDHMDTEIKLQGFVDTIRNGKAMAFIVLKDITGKVQITIEKEKHPELEDVLAQTTPDSVITVYGTAVASEYVKMGGMEVFPTRIVLESAADRPRGAQGPRALFHRSAH